MCDLVAPLLVTFDDEALTHACFSKLMERMLGSAPQMSTMIEDYICRMCYDFKNYFAKKLPLGLMVGGLSQRPNLTE
jgi:hypothetical protein